MEPYSQTIGRFVRGLTIDDIPQAVVDKAKLVLLDTIGVALASSTMEFGAATGVHDGFFQRVIVIQAVRQCSISKHGVGSSNLAVRADQSAVRRPPKSLRNSRYHSAVARLEEMPNVTSLTDLLKP